MNIEHNQLWHQVTYNYQNYTEQEISVLPLPCKYISTLLNLKKLHTAKIRELG